MATGLAVIHWYAGVDGMGNEFVLDDTYGWIDEQLEVASLRYDGEPFCTPSGHSLSFNFLSPGSSSLPLSEMSGRRMQLYVLDLDKASLLSFNCSEAAIQRLMTEVTCNDPYFADPTVNGPSREREGKA
ncbi:hypothetical protein EJ02DRAFT_129169 [Clathrospora elynae]|uniref:DUF3669 domain-containing protein n=1 Tax=Clathrospora elynae TaxID=706981 RepID=A0A6A5SUL3_9PLEO|nr:hypothetical protein EJ02DRAFT_129169 [Clathrospora elynae]